MTEKGNDILTVIDEQGRFCGVVQFESLSRKSEGNISEVMDENIPTATESGEIRTTLEMMLKEKRVWLPVVDEERRLKGIVTMTQFACFFTQEAQDRGKGS